MKPHSNRRFAILFLIYFILLGFLLFWNFDSAGVDINKMILGIGIDKYIHFAMFLPFPVLLYGIFRCSIQKPWQIVAFTVSSFLLGAVIAGGSELVQGLLPYRSANIGDFEADSLGIATGCIITLISDLSRQFNRTGK